MAGDGGRQHSQSRARYRLLGQVSQVIGMHGSLSMSFDFPCSAEFRTLKETRSLILRFHLRRSKQTYLSDILHVIYIQLDISPFILNV
jgi:hypothetical protein